MTNDSCVKQIYSSESQLVHLGELLVQQVCGDVTKRHSCKNYTSLQNLNLTFLKVMLNGETESIT